MSEHWDTNLTKYRATHLIWLYTGNHQPLHAMCIRACKRAEVEDGGLPDLLRQICLKAIARSQGITPKMVRLADFVQLAKDWRERFIEIEGAKGPTPYERSPRCEVCGDAGRVARVEENPEARTPAYMACVDVGACVSRTAERLSEGKPVVGEHPDCICNGDTVTLWECSCPECTQLAGEITELDAALEGDA
jgi:hypothetical protein